MMARSCCCDWGAAVGRFSVPGVKGNIPSGEWPEFDCVDCPTHGGETHGHRCRWHAGLEQNR